MEHKFNSKLLLAAAVFILAETIAVVALFSGNRTKSEKIREQQALIEEQNSDAFVAEKITSTIDTRMLTQEIHALGELATVEYLYTDASHFSDTKQFQGYDIPLTTKSFLVKWDGVIKAGVDVTEIAIHTDEDEKEILIRIPGARILSNEIDNDSFETLNETDGLFNKVTVDDVNSLVGENKGLMEKRAIENGILEKAADNAKAIILQLLDADQIIHDNYKVKIEFMEEG